MYKDLHLLVLILINFIKIKFFFNLVLVNIFFLKCTNNNFNNFNILKTIQNIHFYIFLAFFNFCSLLMFLTLPRIIFKNSTIFLQHILFFIFWLHFCPPSFFVLWFCCFFAFFIFVGVSNALKRQRVVLLSPTFLLYLPLHPTTTSCLLLSLSLC